MATSEKPRITKWARVRQGIVCAVFLLSVAIGAGGSGPGSLQSVSAQAQPTYAEGEIVVRYRTDIPAVMLASAQLSADVQAIDSIEPLNLELVSVEPGKETEVIAELSSNPLVAYVGPNYVARIAGEPNDPAWWRQWNLTQIDAPAAWDLSTGTNLVIAVVDTGVDLSHPDLSAKLVQGYDFANGDSDPQDDHGHGTHVAGIAAAASNNGIGVAGVSWGARIMPLKVLDARGDGTYFNIIQAIQYAADHGARVINLSLGGSQSDPNMLAAINYARERGSLVVAATGNQSGSLLYPAAYDETFAVAATTDRQTRPSYSNFGPATDIAAPGGTQSAGIYGLAPGGGYATQFGTSMATPHVSGLAALLWGLSPNLTAEQLVDIIQETAAKVGTDPYDGSGWNNQLGHGEINAEAALRQVAGSPGPTPTPTNTRPPVWTPTPTLSPTPEMHSLEIDLEEGWNLVSFNVQPADERIEMLTGALRPSLELILSFRCDLGGLSYYPDLPAGVSTLQTMQAGRGYWVKMREARVWRVTGERMDAGAPLGLCRGWNLAGYLPVREHPVPSALSSLGDAMEIALGYENGLGTSYYADLPAYFNTLQTMEPGGGYWIYVSRPAILTYPRE